MNYIINKNKEYWTGEGFDADIKKAKFFPGENLNIIQSVFTDCTIEEYEEDPREGWVQLSAAELVDLSNRMDELGYRTSIDYISGLSVPYDEPLKLSVLDCSCCGILQYVCVSSNKFPFKQILEDCSFFLRLYGDIEISSIYSKDEPLFMDFIHESKLPMSQYEILKMMTTK